jgi:hypothetical protein
MWLAKHPASGLEGTRSEVTAPRLTRVEIRGDRQRSLGKAQ